MDNQYCCLGVLAEELGVLEEHSNHRVIYIDNDSMFCNLPHIMQKELGIEDHTKVLIRMNDCENKSFTEIADWIEENL